jgi:tetratricopeptide (TPR) repeat protein
MEWIWKFEPLVELLDHPESLVREWAMERLTSLYPDRVGPVAARHISDPVEAVAWAALSHLIDRPDGTCADELLKVYATSTGEMAGLAAGALSRLKDTRLIGAFKEKYLNVAREDLQGYAISVAHIANLQAPGSAAIVAGALQQIAQVGEPDSRTRAMVRLVFSANMDAGGSIDSLFEFCFARPEWRPWLTACLTTLGNECGTFYTEVDLEEEDPPGAEDKKRPGFAQRSFAVLTAAGFKKEARRLEKSYRKRRYEEILSALRGQALSLLGDAERRVGAEGFALWVRGKGKPRQHLAVIEALNRQVPGKDAVAQRMMVNAGLWIFAQLMELRHLIGLDAASLETEGLLDVFLQERISVEEDRRIAERLRAGSDPRRVADAILAFIENNPETLAMERLLDYLAESLDARIAGRLLKVQGEGDSLDLIQNLPVVLGRLGAPLLDLLPEIFETRNPALVSCGLNLIQQLPVEGSVNLVLKHWELFWEWDKMSLLEALQDIGDHRFIPPLKRELKGIEIPEALTYRLLCLIHGRKDPLLRKIGAEVERQKRKRLDSLKAIEAGDLSMLFDQPFELDLKCRRCRKTYRYEVHEVTSLSGTKGDYLVADHIRCKNCGAVDHYEKTPDADMAVLGRGLALMAMGDEGRKIMDRGPLQFAESEAIGGKARSIEEALQYYEEVLAKNPGRVSYLIGYANTLRNAKRADDAAAVYRKALDYDPLAVEALLSLGQDALAYGNLKEAYAYLEQAVTVLDSGNYYHVGQDLGEFKAGVYDVYANAALQLGKTPKAPGWAKAAAPKKVKVGRNDPCPCGSGKKYKKCCPAK